MCEVNSFLCRLHTQNKLVFGTRQHKVMSSISKQLILLPPASVVWSTLISAAAIIAYIVVSCLVQLKLHSTCWYCRSFVLTLLPRMLFWFKSLSGSHGRPDAVDADMQYHIWRDHTLGPFCCRIRSVIFFHGDKQRLQQRFWLRREASRRTNKINTNRALSRCPVLNSSHLTHLSSLANSFRTLSSKWSKFEILYSSWSLIWNLNFENLSCPQHS